MHKSSALRRSVLKTKSSHEIMKPFQSIRCFTAALLFTALLAPPTTGFSSDPPAPEKKPDAPAAEEKTETPPAEKKSEPPATHVITRGSIKVKVQLDAVLESVEMAPVKIEPKAWTDFPVLEAVPHGTRVKKGDILVKFDTEKLTDQIEDLEKDSPGAKLALELAEAELKNLDQATPLRLEAAQRSQRRADEDYSYFQSTGREQREKNAHFMVKNAEQRLENAAEELAQLEKMYLADDLTEETEEIILKRQKFAVEAAVFSLESSRLHSERELKVMIPREHENLKSQKIDQELTLALAEVSIPRALVRKQLDLDKLKRDQRKAVKRLADLKADLEQLTLPAPMDGIVYYGSSESGKWPTAAAIAKKLVPNGKLSANEVFITIVNPEKMILRTVVPESDLSRVSVGLKGEASPVSASEKKLAAEIEELGMIPLPGGGFEAKLSFERADGVHLMPGMNAKLTFGDAQKSGVLLAPKDAVFTEGQQKHVFLAKAEGAPEKRTVKTGETDEKMTEIVEGVSEGDTILLKKPE
jgi:HlyD family secretion protein